MDKVAACKKLGATVLFVGDDWYGTEKWKQYEADCENAGIRVVYFPYTKGVSSTKISKALQQARGWTSPTTSEQFGIDAVVPTPENQTVIDKNYCMSSYLAFRYIEKDNVEFFPGLHHKTARLPYAYEAAVVSSEDDVDAELRKQFVGFDASVGIMLSGGMDSSCLASYMPKGAPAYTFRFQGGRFAPEELERAKKIADLNGLQLHYVDIDWERVTEVLPQIMQHKGAPVHSIEPQIYLAARQAAADGVKKLVIGDAADYVFYGMDGLLAEDWTFDAFVRRSIYIDPKEVLNEPTDILYLYERYRQGEGIDFIKFYDKSIAEESYSSYENAMETAGMAFVDPYETLKMAKPVDLARTRAGDSKYFIRRLFRKRYPSVELPQKSPMPRPVDAYFAQWGGPTRPEFRKDIDMTKYSGNQKWLLWCLEQFLNLYDPLKA